jgi:hypothetical protein
VDNLSWIQRIVLANCELPRGSRDSGRNPKNKQVDGPIGDSDK